jgi:hypothetical protein
MYKPSIFINIGLTCKRFLFFILQGATPYFALLSDQTSEKHEKIKGGLQAT